MEINIVGKIITVIIVVSTTIMLGIMLGAYMLANIDFEKYNRDFIVEFAE